MADVIIGDILPYTQATASLGQTLFNTNWTANVASDVVVYKTPVGFPPSDELFKLNFPADYSVNFIGALLQVQVILTVPAAAGDIITITRQTPADRLNLYTNTNFTPSMLNNDFEILTLVDQQAQLVDQLIGPRYNYSAEIAPDNSFPNENIILPILAANQIWVKANDNHSIVTLDVPSTGFAPAGDTYVLLTPDVSGLPNSFALSSLGAGLLVNNPSGTNILVTTVAGTTHEITVVNGSGVGGNITLSIPDNPIMPGTAGMGIPIGTTAQRVIPLSNINLRYNTDLEAPEFWNGSTWVEIAGADIITPGAINDLAYYAAAGTTLSPIATVNSAVLSTSNLGVPTWLGPLTDGQLIIGSTGSSPVANTLTQGAGVTITNGAGTITISASGTGGTVTSLTAATGITLTPNPITTTGTIGLTIPVAISSGGTGVTALPLVPTASAFAAWDVNKNFSANSFISGYTTTATAGATTTLTVASTYQQFFTGTLTQTVVMPVTSTLVLGQQYEIVNNSSGNLTVQSSGGNTILTMTTNTVAYLTVVSTSLTTAAAWYFEFLNQVESVGTVTSVATGTGLTGGPITTTGTISLITPVALNIGGTNANLTASNGGIVWSNATQLQILAGTATAGLALLSGASGPPTWSTNKPITKINTQIFNVGTSTYTISVGLVQASVRGVSGGGGSGGIAFISQGTANGGGAGGGYFEKLYTAAQIGATATVVVGAGGAAGASGNNAGGTGGTTSFTPAGAGAVLSATGGAGSAGSAGSSTPQNGFPAAGSGGVATGGDINITGGAGSPGFTILSTSGLSIGGAGGGSAMGTPSFNPAFSTGFAANNYGSGADGTVQAVASNVAGKAGADGIVIITEYISA